MSTTRALLAALCAIACGGRSSTGPPPVTSALVARAMARTPGVDRAALERGREVFVTRCGECHALPDPAAHTAAEWPGLMQRMGRLAALDDATRAYTLAYLLAARED